MKNKTTITKCREKVPLADRFWKKVNKVDGCWEWLGAKTAFGYGLIGDYVGSKLKMLKAHRLSWSFSCGEIPGGMCVLHKCDNPGCVNPDHLFLGTYKDNVNDCVNKGRFNHDHSGFVVTKNSFKGVDNGKAKLNDAKVKEIRALLGNETIEAIANTYNVTRQAIRDISNGRTWRHSI